MQPTAQAVGSDENDTASPVEIKGNDELFAGPITTRHKVAGVAER
jgi:hypothetical protein